MDDFDPAAYREAFLQANANEPFIASQLADVIRALIRAVSSDEGSSGIYAASEKMKFISDLIARSPDPITWYGLFNDAVHEIQHCIPDDPDDRKYINAAKRGMKYLVESSATDNVARGRASKRLREFQNAIRWSTEARGGRL
jgi:hypothetical protein